MKLYRAVPLATFVAGTTYTRQETRRIPTNVPYLVDNVWELLRPEHAPSRRHAVYASPTPFLAAENASAGETGTDMVICELTFADPTVRMAHLPVTDARFHKDVRDLPRLAVKALGADFGALPLAQKLEFSPLFMPGISREEFRDAVERHPIISKFMNDACCISTFWHEAQPKPVLNHNGELFFELHTDNSYTLTPLRDFVI